MLIKEEQEMEVAMDVVEVAGGGCSSGVVGGCWGRLFSCRGGYLADDS